jgi:hypothetical protein
MVDMQMGQLDYIYTLLLNRLNFNKKDRAYNSLDPIDLSFNNKSRYKQYTIYVLLFSKFYFIFQKNEK